MTGIKIVATNRKAGRDYVLQDHREAGVVLMGTEIKSIRPNKKWPTETG